MWLRVQGTRVHHEVFRKGLVHEPPQINVFVRAKLPHVEPVMTLTMKESEFVYEKVYGVQGNKQLPPNVTPCEVPLGKLISCPHPATRMVPLLPLHEDGFVVNPLFCEDIISTQV